MRLRLKIVFLLYPALAAVLGKTAADERVVAVFESGRRISGEAVKNWSLPGMMPQLDGQSLLEGDDPLAWLLDTGLDDRPAPPAMIEFVNGDRFPGVVVGYSPAAASANAIAVPEHLIVAPLLPLRNSRSEPVARLRVLPSMVRRIWTTRFNSGMGGKSPAVVTSLYKPGTLLARDGGRLAFRRLRFHEDGVTLLTESGLVRMELAEIAELDLPQADPWAAYCDEVAALTPRLDDRLVQVETVDGLAATTSMVRYRAMAYSSRGDPNRWFHLIQPAWSLDAFTVRHNDVRARRWFSPDRVPLVHLATASETNRSRIHTGWHAQSNRNAYGGPLAAGGKLHGWGIGVHGACELVFPLSPLATGFETGIGIDGVSGSGGCLRARVLLRRGDVKRGSGDRGEDDQTSRVLFTSDVLQGSQRVQQTGRLSLDAAGSGDGPPLALVLSVDPLNGGPYGIPGDDDPDSTNPAGADPLDVRDAADWLEPVLHLDREALRQAVEKRRWQRLIAADGWEVLPDDQAAARYEHWNAEAGQGANFRFSLSSPGRVELRRTLKVPSSQAVLLVAADRLPESAPATIGIRVGDTPLAEHELPLRYSGGDEPEPLIAPLGRWVGQSIEARIVLAPAPGADAEKNIVVDLRSIVMADRPDDLSGDPADPPDGNRFAVAASASLSAGGLAPGREKDVRNRWLELRVMAEEHLDDDACKLIAGLSLEYLLTPLEYPDGARKKTPLAELVLRLVAAHPGIETRMREKYDGIAGLRLERAIADCDLLRVAAIGVQFPGTEAAARSQAWLGDRQLSRGEFAAAAEFYRWALRGISPSQRRLVAERLEMAESLAK